MPKNRKCQFCHRVFLRDIFYINSQTKVNIRIDGYKWCPECKKLYSYFIDPELVEQEELISKTE